VFASQTGADQCDFGTKDCPCLSDNTCSFGELTCRGGFCREDRIEDATTTAASEEEDEDGGGDNQTAIIVGASVGVVCCVIIAAAIVFGVLTMAIRKQEVVQRASGGFPNRPPMPSVVNSTQEPPHAEYGLLPLPPPSRYAANAAEFKAGVQQEPNYHFIRDADHDANNAAAFKAGFSQESKYAQI
jgi:hypothetical protein